MFLIGVFYLKKALQTKYEFEISPEVINKDIIRLTNQIWKLIPMKEHFENWQKQIDTVIIEITGLNKVLRETYSFTLLQLLSKLEGLKQLTDLPFEIYLKTVFETINLLQELKY